MKRSNRLVLLIGVFLAIVAFVAIILLQGGPSKNQPEVATDADTVIATSDIPLGSRITADQITVNKVALTGRDADSFGAASQVIGQIVRQPVTAGQAITARTLAGGSNPGQILNIQVPAGKRAITVQVDQVTGVGTVIKTGDYVDMVVAIPKDNFPVVAVNPTARSYSILYQEGTGIYGTSVKVLLQGMQVLGTLLPPPTTTTQDQQQQGAQPSAQPGKAHNGPQEIVALAVDAQQAEVIKFAQMLNREDAISLILRSPDDFIDPATGKPYETPKAPDGTTGIILKTLIDRYAVLPPELVETVLPPGARPR
ncbi:MAG TPA: Flp pilus assembly protein CpaB [Candidatus Limnocylindrales bacterium]|nr:Flp pilus assembly protein CpaB [Candidatus Limnocylindrales bacterium]